MREALAAGHDDRTDRDRMEPHRCAREDSNLRSCDRRALEVVDRGRPTEAGARERRRGRDPDKADDHKHDRRGAKPGVGVEAHHDDSWGPIGVSSDPRRSFVRVLEPYRSHDRRHDRNGNQLESMKSEAGHNDPILRGGDQRNHASCSCPVGHDHRMSKEALKDL